MKRLLLLSVGRSFFKGALWGAYDLEPPLNAAYTAAFLEMNSVATDVIDLQVYKDSNKKINEIDFHKYSIIGINSDLASTRMAYKLAELVKQKCSIKIFAFGVFTILKEKILEECRHIDIVVYGEEEYTVLEVAQTGNESDIKGLIYRNNDGKIIVNQPRSFIKNLDELPHPARDKFDMKKYFPSPGKYLVLPQFSVLSARGCDWHCFFCSNLRGKGTRYRSTENIISEIDELQEKYGVKEINFIDDTFTADKDRILQFADVMKKRRKKVYIRACSRVDTVDRQVLKELKEAGLYSMGYGIESGDDAILKFNNKGITTEQVKEAVKISKELGLETRGFFMLNMPGDTISTTEKTIKFIKELELDLVNVQITYPWPGTPMRKYVKKNYRINEDIWNNREYCDGDDVLFIQSDLTREYILNTYKKIIKDHYINVKFIFKWLKRLKTWNDFKYSFLQFVTICGKVRTG